MFEQQAIKDTVLTSVRRLRSLKPETPIVLVDHLGYPQSKSDSKTRMMESNSIRMQRLAYEQLKKEGVKEILLDLAERFSSLEPFTAAAGEEMVKGLSQGNGMGPWVHPIRVAVSGRMEGPGLFEMLELLGRDTVVSRLRAAAENC
jgi:glutamyl/glutaminyl-tRNA synthetase